MGKNRQFIVRDECTLCVDGYPIQIIRHNARSYEVLVDGVSSWLGITLNAAKEVAMDFASDLDVFAPAPPKGE